MKCFLFLIFLVLPVSAYAQTACTQMGCINGLTIKLTPDIIRAPGQYTLAIAAGDDRITCKGMIPLSPCEKGPTFSCNSKSVRITESGCALPVGQQTVSEILIGGRPRQVMIGFSLKDKSYMIRTLKPVYQFFRPNGPACAPQCIVSTINLSRQLGGE